MSAAYKRNNFSVLKTNCKANKKKSCYRIYVNT